MLIANETIKYNNLANCMVSFSFFFFSFFPSLVDLPSVLDVDLVLLLWPPIITIIKKKPKACCNYLLTAAIVLLPEDLTGSSLG